jgi:lysophospholipase L1-like esterase
LPTLLPFNLLNQTVRQRLRLSLGGDRLRIVLSNEYGTAPLTIDAVHCALPGGEGLAIDAGSNTRVTFNTEEQVVIPAGAAAISDPILLSAAPLSELLVSFFVAKPTPIATFHWSGEQTGYIAPGNQSANPVLHEPAETTTRIFLSGVMVEAPDDVAAVVALGDSITDGVGSGIGQNARWPDFLAENLVPHNVAVLNAGIAGGQLLRSRMGENAVARFTRDVLRQPKVRSVVLLIGINDIAWPEQPFAPADRLPKIDELIAGYLQVTLLARMHDIRVVAGTLTPFQNALKETPLEGYYSEKRDALRRQVNAWIRESGVFDAVVDLDQLVACRDNPLIIGDALHADYLHLSALGNKLVADAMTPEILFGPCPTPR